MGTGHPRVAEDLPKSILGQSSVPGAASLSQALEALEVPLSQRSRSSRWEREDRASVRKVLADPRGLHWGLASPWPLEMNHFSAWSVWGWKVAGALP